VRVLAARALAGSGGPLAAVRKAGSSVFAMSVTATATRSLASIVDGRVRDDAPGGRLRSTNPARLDDVVADLALGDAATFVDAARAARAAQREWRKVPGAPLAGA